MLEEDQLEMSTLFSLVGRARAQGANMSDEVSLIPLPQTGLNILCPVWDVFVEVVLMLLLCLGTSSKRRTGYLCNFKNAW